MKICRYSKLLSLKTFDSNIKSHQIHDKSIEKLYKNYVKPILPTNDQLIQPSNYLRKKFNDFVVWYEQFTGMDEVRMMQKRVLETQDKFVLSQEKRRDASRELAHIQSQLKDLYAELDTTNRGEERYLQLITQEHSVLKEERKLQAEFSLLEREERDTFTLLSNCVKESHEKERAQAERTKYWSVIGSILGTIIGIVGSSVNNEFKMRELRRLVKEASLKMTSTPSELLKHEKELMAIVSELKYVVHKYPEFRGEGGDQVRRIEQLLQDVNQKREKQLSSYMAHSMENINESVEDVKRMLSSTLKYKASKVALPPNIEALMEAHQMETKLILVGATIIGFLIPVLMSYALR